MKKFQILATFPGSDDERGCGYQEAMTALDAVVREISGSMVDTEGATSIGAYDEDATATAYRVDGGWEVHVQVGDVDTWFTL